MIQGWIGREPALPQLARLAISAWEDDDGGQDAVVVISAEEYDRLTRPAVGIVEFLAASPLADVHLDLSRPPDTGRDVDL